jgi:hypothetical protein
LNKPKILIWFSGPRNDPSRRYRFDCYKKQYNLNFEVYYSENFSLKNNLFSKKIILIIYNLLIVDIVLLQRRVLPIFLLKILKYFNKKIVFDVDDGIHNYTFLKNYNFKKFGSLISLIIVGNINLYKYWSNINSNTIIIPTGVQYSIYKNREFNNACIKFLWLGSSSNISNLDIFINLYKKIPLNEVELTIISDIQTFSEIEKLPNIKFELWNENKDMELANSNIPYIGIMPLNINDIHSEYKCSFKMLQYMNWSMPVIVTACGMNKDLLCLDNIGFELTNLDNLLNVLKQFKNDEKLYSLLAYNGNKIIKENYTHNFIFEKYNKVLNNNL